MTFRPIDTAMSPTPDVGASALSGTDLSHSTLSQVSGADFAKANQFFQADGGAASQALTGIDIQGIAAPAPLSGTEALAMMPPTGGVEAGVLGAVPGAEPISPMIQLIMKLPGAMGLISSFFDFLAAFFSPTGLFDMLNPAMWAQHAAVAFSNTAASLPTISMGMLPSNAPILSSLTGIGQPMFSSDLLSAKLNLSLGNSSYSSLAKSGVDAMQGNSLNVGAELTPQSAVYETGAGAVVPGQVPSGHLSGPSLTDVGSANHVANNTRLFSDRLGSGSSFNSMNLAAKTPSPLGNTAASGMGQSTAGSSLAHGMNPIAQAGNFNQPGSFLSNARFEGAPQIAQQLKTNFVPNSGHEVGYSMNPGVGQDVGFNAASPNTDASGVTYGPSGYVGNDLASGGNNNLIAMDQPTQSFKPTLSGDGQQFRSAFPSGNQGQMAQGGSNAGSSMTGLKAKQLSLESLDSNATSTASGAANGKLSAASANKVGDAGAKSVSSDAVKAAKAPAHEVHKVAHEAPKQVAHKANHTVAKAKPAETVAKQPSEATQQSQAADGNLAQDGTVADGTQIAANDNANAVTQYTVQKGDNLWNIAKEQLGGGAKWQEIYQLNQNLIGQNPDMIYPGTTLQLPGGAPEIASTGTTTMTDYVVKPGDNLWDISQDLLGDATKWGDIYKANQDLIGSNPGMIHPGQQLQIPSSDPAGATVASNAVDPTAQAAAVDPNAMGAPSAQPADMGMADAGSVKSMQAGGTEYGAVAPEQYVAPQAQAIPQQVSSYPEAQGFMSAAPQAQFQPTIAPHQPTIAHQGKGLPVIPANSVPIEAGPGAAWAATPKPVVDVAANTAQAAQAAAASNVAKGQVVAGGVFSNMKSLLGKTQ